MDSFANVYEERYAKDSFENDSDEIPEIYDSESESHDDDIPVRRESLYTYARNQLSLSRPGSAHFQRNKAPCDSSSDDDKDVVVSETIAEINTAPMRMDEALYSPESSPGRKSEGKQLAPASRYVSKPVSGPQSHPQPQLKESYAELDERQTESETTEGEQTNDEDNEENEDDYNEEEDFERPPELEEEEDAFSDNSQNKFLPRDQESGDSHAEDDLTMMNNMMQREEVAEDTASADVNASARSRSNDSEEDHPPRDQDYESAGEEEHSNEDYDEKYDPRFQVQITTRTPTSFNTDDYPFHLSFVNQSESTERFRMRQGQRKSWSFSNARMREIERENQILLRKILTQKPTYVLNSPKGTQSKKFASLPPTTRKSSAAVNRKKQQRQIDLDNQGLKRRIEAIAKRPITQNHK